MNKELKSIKICLITIFSLLVLFGCNANGHESTLQPSNQINLTQNETEQSDSRSQPKQGGTLKIIFQEEIRNMGFPAEDVASLTAYYRSPALETLGRYENGVITPWLAEKWEYDSENKTITFYLKQGIQFHDGTDFNAEAVKWNIERFQDYKRAEVSGIKSIDVIDEYTVQLNLEQWDLSILESVAYFVQMISPTAVEKNGEEWAMENPVGTGPFTLDSWERDVSAKFVKNENYWIEGQPYLDRIELLFIADENTAANAFKSGEAHVIAHIDPLTIVELEASDQYVLQENEDLGRRGYGLLFSSSDKDSPFADVNVRKAVLHAIDTQAIVDSVFFGLGDITNQWYLPGSRFYNPDLNGVSYDPEKAKQLLAEAGYVSGFDTQIIAIPSDQEHVTAIQSYLSEIGIKAEIKMVDFGQRVAMATNGFEGILSYMRPMMPNAPVMAERNFGKDTGAFRVNIVHPVEKDQLIKKAKQANDYDEMATKIQELQKVMFDEHALFHPLFSPPTAIFMTKDVQNLHMMKLNSHDWNPESVWLSE